MSRDINLRPYDDSSIFKNPNTFEYLKRLFFINSYDEMKNTNETLNPILNIMTHNIFQVSKPAFQDI